MIVSHRHRFIFIKTVKTAGTSVELYLRQFCGPDDIVTWLDPEDEALALAAGFGGARNFGPGLLPPWRLRKEDFRWMRNHRRYRRSYRYIHHMPASLIKERVGDDIWNNYTKITIVRDPWERALSLHYWRNSLGARQGPTLDDSIEWAAGNWKIYTIDDQPVIDHFIRYESLQSDLEALRDRLGLGGEVDLMRAKGDIRPPGSVPREILTDKQALRIAELAHKEIELFGYRWDGPEPLPNDS